MPNYKSKMLTFLSIGEMTGLLLDNTDEDGILFAVATDATNFKIVMWRKTSTATVDNETVYPANGPGRWHVLATGTQSPKEVMTVVGDTLPGTIGLEVDLIAQKKTNGDKVLKGRFNGIFEDFSANNIAVYDDSLGSATPPSGMKMAVVNKTTGDELYVAKNNTWELLDITGGGSSNPISFADINGIASIGQVPTGTTSTTVALGDHSHTLNDLSDVTITSPVNGHTISYNGTNWVNQAVASVEGNIIQFATGSLPPSPSVGKSICILTKTNPLRNLIYRWNGSGWEIIAYTNILEEGSSGGPVTPGDCIGQISIINGVFPPAIFCWDNTGWTQLYP